MFFCRQLDFDGRSAAKTLEGEVPLQYGKGDFIVDRK
jgi:hypothetical protein